MNDVILDQQAVSDRDYRLVSEFLFREAELLDAGRFTEWLTMVADDIHYRLVGPTVTMLRSGEANADPEVLLLDETMGTLKFRVRQLSTPQYTIAENPRSFMRRFVTNVVVMQGSKDDLIEVSSNTFVFRSRDTQAAPNFFATSRKDVLRRHQRTFRLVRRRAQLDEAVISARNISTLF